MSGINNIFNRTIKGSFYLFTGTMINFISSMIISIIIIRVLGPVDYGLYSILYSIPTLLIIIGDLGLSQSLLRYVSKYSENENDSLSIIMLVMFIKLIFSSILFIILNVFSNEVSLLLKRDEISSYIFIISVFFITGSYLNTCRNSLIGLEKTKEYSIIVILLSIINLFIILYYVTDSSSLYDILNLITINNILNFMILMAYLLFQIKSFKLHGLYNRYKILLIEILAYAFPIYLSSVVIRGQNQLLQLILARNVSNYDIGNYSISMNFTVLINVVVMSIISNILSTFSKIDYRENKEEYKKLLPMIIKYFSIVMIFIAVGISIISEELIFVIFGSEYLAAKNYMIFYMFTYLVISLGDVMVMVFLNSQGDTRVTFNITLLNFLILVPSSYYLTGIYSINGLISSIFISKIISSFYGLKILKIEYDISLDLMASIKIMGTYLMSFLVINYIDANILKLNVFLNGFVKLLIYVLLLVPTLYVIKVFDKKDLDYFRETT